jgi:hypothetical protein
MRKPALTSRKFWVAVGTILAIILSDILGVDLEPETVVTVVVAVAAYILGESWVDGRGVK